MAVSRPHDQDGAVGVTNDGVGDVAKEGPLQSAESAAAHHDQVGADLLGQVDDRLVAAFVHLEVGDRDGAARRLDLPDLFVEYLLGLTPEVVVPRLDVDIVYRCGKRAPDRDDVEPRVGALREV